MPEWCHDESCQVETGLTLEQACAQGWDLIEDFTYCPLHRQEAARRALRAHEDARLRELAVKMRAERNAHRAATCLTRTEYRAWDEFQSDLANFHREHGKPAPAALRTLDPRRWRDQYAKTGRIDVELAADSLSEAEKRAEATRAWLLERG